MRVFLVSSNVTNKSRITYPQYLCSSYKTHNMNDVRTVHRRLCHGTPKPYKPAPNNNSVTNSIWPPSTLRALLPPPHKKNAWQNKTCYIYYGGTKNLAPKERDTSTAARQDYRMERMLTPPAPPYLLYHYTPAHGMGTTGLSKVTCANPPAPLYPSSHRTPARRGVSYCCRKTVDIPSPVSTA